MLFSVRCRRFLAALIAACAASLLPASAQTNQRACSVAWQSALSVTTRQAYEYFVQSYGQCPQAHITELLIAEGAYFPEGRAPNPSDPETMAAAAARAEAFSIRSYDDWRARQMANRRLSWVSDDEYHQQIFAELPFVLHGASNFTLGTVAQELMRWAGRGANVARESAEPEVEFAHVSRRVEIGRFFLGTVTLRAEERYAVDRDYAGYLEATGRLTEARDQIASLLDRSSQRPPLERASLQLRLRSMYDTLGDTVSADRYARGALATYRAAPESAFLRDGAPTKYRIHEAALEAAARAGDEREMMRLTEFLEGAFRWRLDDGSETLRILAAGPSAAAARRGMEIAERSAAELDPSGNNRDIERLYCGMGMVNAAHRIQSLSRDGVLRQLRRCESNEQYRSWRMRAQAGAAYERLGELEQAERWYQSAIESAEIGRATIPVAERVAYFRGAIKSVYDGLIRVNARRHLEQNGDARSFAAVLDATQRIRARQFSDLSEREEPRFDLAALRALQSRLVDGDLIIGAVPLQEQTIAWHIGPRSFGISSRPLGANAMEQRVRRVLQAISTPATPLETVEQELVTFTSDVLGPIQQQLASSRRAVFLLDGPLALTPPSIFSVSANAYQPLIHSALVQSAPSASALLLGEGSTNWREQLFAMGDPTYPSLREQRATANAGAGRVQISSRGDLSILPLPETREEVQIVAEALGGRSAVAFGTEASESRLRGGDLRGVRFIHLATHGFLAGELAGVNEPALLLASDNENDGFLLMSEAQQLRLDAELTVLSACNTGSGIVFDGEGVMGLSRAFLLAGSRAVLVSMWPVDSEATVDYMSSLYRYLGAGVHAADANVRAMRDVRQQYQHPFYWAPFSLISNSGLIRPSLAPAASPVVASTVDARRLAARTPAPVLAANAMSPDFAAFRDCDDLCPEMIVIPGGRFLMGASPQDSDAGNEERPQREVRVERLAVGRFEVTRGEYFAFANATDRLRYATHTCYQHTEESLREFVAERGLDRAWMPMTCLSWTDAQAYVDWLSQRTGQSYRLLTEAEWEYAARAGTTTRFWWGDDDDPQVHAARNERLDVRAGGANGFGLYGISSIGEWVEDCFVWGYASARNDAAAVATPRTCDRTIRDWYDYRITARYTRPPEIPTEWDDFDSDRFGRYQYIGFRVARVLAPQ